MKILLLLAIFCGSLQAAAQENEVPQASLQPLAQMQKLRLLTGHWNVVLEVTEDEGKTWTSMPTEKVKIAYRHKNMILSEIPADLSSPAFHMETHVTYDQFRNIYRKAAVDDVWGIMDIYDGALTNDTIVFTNLRSGTTFPIAENTWRNFKLTYQLASPVRTLVVEKSDDKGETWQAAFKATYTLISE